MVFNHKTPFKSQIIQSLLKSTLRIWLFHPLKPHHRFALSRSDSFCTLAHQLACPHLRRRSTLPDPMALMPYCVDFLPTVIRLRSCDMGIFSCYVSAKEANYVNSQKNHLWLWGHVIFPLPLYKPTHPFHTFYFHVPTSTIDLPCQIWRLSLHLIPFLHIFFCPVLLYSSPNCLRDLILAIHPVRPPCLPICLRTLLLSDLIYSFAIPPPDLTVLMFCHYFTSSSHQFWPSIVFFTQRHT